MDSMKTADSLFWQRVQMGLQKVKMHLEKTHLQQGFNDLLTHT